MVKAEPLQMDKGSVMTWTILIRYNSDRIWKKNLHKGFVRVSRNARF